MTAIRLYEISPTVEVVHADDKDHVAQILVPVEEWWPALWDYYDTWHRGEAGDKPAARA